MARASRSSKKQPAFDPSELQDLIFSPAVGSGVGSHLLQTTQGFPAPGDAERNTGRELATVDTSLLSPVDKSDCQTTTGLRSAASIFKHLDLGIEVSADTSTDMSTVYDIGGPTVVERSTVSGDQPSPRNSDNIATVDRALSPTVDRLAFIEIREPTTTHVAGETNDPGEAVNLPNLLNQGREESVEISAEEVTPHADMATVAISGVATVEPSETQQKKTPLKEVLLWVTEHGDLVPQGRVKRIRLAQDVINPAEESVYDTLWAVKSQTDERESSRIVQAGYDYLVKRTRLSKKTIQRIVAKLIDKDFIAIERPADIYQRTSTVYRVFSYKAVLDRHLRRGRSHVAKMGPGFCYVRPIKDPRLPVTPSAHPGATPSNMPVNMSTVATSHTTTVDRILLSTPANRTTVTVPESDQSTVGCRTTAFIGIDGLENNTSSSSDLYRALSQYGAVDDDILDRLIRNCKQHAPDCTEEEIIHFIQEKGSLVRVRDTRIYSPIGFLLTAVPKCLSGEAFRFYREEQVKRREAEAAYEAKRQAEMDEWRKEQEARLEDPTVSEQDKKFIRECLGLR